jgi:phosphate starvation-inducible PhoH-like protein
MSEATIPVIDQRAMLALFGTRDQHLRRIRQALGVTIAARDNVIAVSGEAEAVTKTTKAFEQLQALLRRQGSIGPEDVDEVLSQITGATSGENHTALEFQHGGRSIRPKTAGQVRYVQAIADHDLTFCIGPAGTGKTYLAVAMAVQALKQEYIRKIVLVRPAVEAGESLGYLPGDLQAKINPYLRPLLDALREMLDYEQVRRYTEQDLIEMIPLAYMRGRTLNDAFVILDEAQNCTVAQMKMFLTRMGHRTKMVVAGDATQVDLPQHARSGLIDAVTRLRGIRGVAEVNMEETDIVRHRLVQEIVRAYAEDARPKR